MAWRAPTEDDLLGSISNAELTAYRRVAVSDDQTDPVTKKLADVVNYVRGFIAVKHDLGEEDTLPETIIGLAMDYLAVDVIKRLPGRKVDDERSEARKAAIATFRLIADGKYVVETPETETEETFGGTPSPSIGTRTRNFEASDQDGI